MEGDMPEIIVTAAGPPRERAGGEVLLRERVSAADFESERFAANLIERLEWAVEDATEFERRGAEFERRGRITGRAKPARRPVEGQSSEREPEPVGTR
jgi:hypothetical protein